MYELTMVIKEAKPIDGGNYFCKANNTHGNARRDFHINIIPQLETGEDNFTTILDCCKRFNVSEDCQSICSLNLDLDLLLNKPKCFPQFNAIMKCASGNRSQNRKMITDIFQQLYP